MIIVKLISEVLGSPKEHVDKALNLILDKIKEQNGLKVADSKFFEAQKMEDKPLFTGFIEYTIEVEDPQRLIDFCFDFMPSSLEIIEPDELDMKSVKFADMLNDLLAKLHRNEMALRNLIAEKQLSRK